MSNSPSPGPLPRGCGAAEGSRSGAESLGLRPCRSLPPWLRFCPLTGPRRGRSVQGEALPRECPVWLRRQEQQTRAQRARIPRAVMGLHLGCWREGEGKGGHDWLFVPTLGWSSLPERSVEEGATRRLDQLGQARLPPGILAHPLDPGQRLLREPQA